MIMHIQSPNIVKTVHLNIFKDIDAYSGTLTRTKTGREKITKSWPDFGKIGLGYVHLCVKSSIENVILKEI